MKGKRVVVTGSTSGIGKEIAAQLATRGAEVVLACRDEQKGEETKRELAARTGSQSLSVMPVDTSSPRSIADFARRFRDQHVRLDVLVNNAGVSLAQKQKTADDLERCFATNVLGYHLVARGLLDVLTASAPSRIVNVASTFAHHLDLDDLQWERRPYSATNAYAQTKACDRLLTWALARRLEGTGVTVNAMCPGMVQTPLYRETPSGTRLFLRILGLFIGRSIQQGADTAVWLASSAEAAGITGKLFERRKEIPCAFRSVEAEEKLWAICEKLAG
jgi:NAD(P)-dependent dehydrogenase (short-subunit alcohol dehydrogenase family)